jgi:hypothetical protein
MSVQTSSLLESLCQPMIKSSMSAKLVTAVDKGNCRGRGSAPR